MSSQNRFHDQILARKALLRDPTAVIRDLTKLLTNKSDVASLDRIAEQFNPLFEQRSSLTESRKAHSALIGKARKSGDDYQALVYSSKELSKQLNHINNQVEALVEKVMVTYGKSAATFGNDTSDRNAGDHENTLNIGPSQFLPLVSSDAKIPI